MRILISAFLLASVAVAEDGKSCVGFQVVEGSEDVYGVPEVEKPKAYTSWKVACEEWKLKIRELNASNQVITTGCSRPKPEKEDAAWVYRGTGLYKIRVRIQETAQTPSPKESR